jgi:predicted nucleic acid-binding protein
VLGELHYGAQRAQHPERQETLIALLIGSSRVVPCDEETARQYASIRRRLEQQGTRIPENDIWIAAAAAQHQLRLVTRDPHFSHLHWMQIELW